MDAVKELAESAGMQLPAPDPKAAAKAERANSLYDVMAAAQQWFVAQYQGLEGAAARAYCERRGLSAETIKTFGIGFAPDSRGKLKDALKQFGEDKLVEAGLLISVDGKDPYDRFRGRLMIPIRDPRGRVIAFGGRILGAGEPKYLNSPDTPLFDKGRTLYNLDRASAASRASGRVIVVEGYMDVIALAQAGFEEAVAPLGTALTEQQIAMLWRMVPKPLLCFDGDSAGQKASFRAAERALGGLKPGHSLEFVTLPEGQDPDDVVRSAGPRAFADLIEQSEPLVDRVWKTELAAAPVSTPEDRAGLKQRLGVHLAAIADGEIRHHYSEAFRERFDMLFRRATPNFAPSAPRKGPWRPNTPPPASAEAKAIGHQGPDLLFPAILAALLRDPAQILRHQEVLASFTPRDPGHARLLSAMLDCALSRPAKEMLDSTALLTILGADLYNKAQALLQGGGTAFGFNRLSRDEELAGAAATSQLDEAIRLMKQRPELEAALQRATELASTDLNEANYAEQQRLRQEKQDFDARLAALLQREDAI
jgi:DNA primase